MPILETVKTTWASKPNAKQPHIGFIELTRRFFTKEETTCLSLNLRGARVPPIFPPSSSHETASEELNAAGTTPEENSTVFTHQNATGTLNRPSTEDQSGNMTTVKETTAVSTQTSSSKSFKERHQPKVEISSKVAKPPFIETPPFSQIENYDPTKKIPTGKLEPSPSNPPKPTKPSKLEKQAGDRWQRNPLSRKTEAGEAGTVGAAASHSQNRTTTVDQVRRRGQNRTKAETNLSN